MTVWPSPSRYGFADTCGFPWGPAAPRWPKRAYEPTDYQRHGNAISLVGWLLAAWGREALVLLPDVLERPDVMLSGARAESVRECAERMADYLESYGVTHREGETAIALDMRTGKAQRVESARRPPAHHAAGAIDLLEVDASGRLVVSDWKSGFAQARDMDIRTDPQVRSYALMAARLFGVREVVSRVLHVSPDSDVDVDEAVFDALELGIIREEMTERFDRVSRATLPVSGPHCTRCPIFTACPAMRAGVEMATRRMTRLPVVRDRTEIQDADHAGYTRQLGKFLVEEGERLKAIARDWVADPEGNAGRAIEIAPGVMYGPALKAGTESIDLGKPGAVEAVREVLGAGAAWAAGVNIGASKASLERGAKVRAKELAEEEQKRVTAKSVYEPLYDRLRSIGAMRRGAPIEQMMEFPKRSGEQ